MLPFYRQAVAMGRSWHTGKPRCDVTQALSPEHLQTLPMAELAWRCRLTPQPPSLGRLLLATAAAGKRLGVSAKVVVQ
jgi:hypothetical protein